MGIDPRSWSAS